MDFEVKITLDGAVPNIRPGLSAKAEIVVADRNQALAVPLGAVTVRDYPMLREDVRQYSGKRGRKQAQALADFGFKARTAKRDSSVTEVAEVKPEEKEGVFIIVDDFVKFMPVELGVAGEDDFEVLSGLEEGQKVVTGPFRILRELKDGALVKAVKSKSNRGGDKSKSDD